MQDRTSAGAIHELPLQCPNCNGNLKETYAEANYGRVLLLDQCERCGGVWFDQWELYLLREAEARRLDRVDEDGLLSSNLHPHGEGRCPRCRLKLETFNDPSFPKDSQIMRCKCCGGLWLNRGELVRYGNNKETLLGGIRQPVETYVPVLEGEERIDAVKRLGNALNLKTAEEPPPLELIDDEESLKRDVMAIIFQILMKLLFKI